MKQFASFTEFQRWNEEMFQRFSPEQYFFSPNPFVRWLERSRVRRARELLAVRDGECVLDVGCGTGFMMHQIEGGRVVGTDLSTGALKIARERLPDHELLRGDAMRLPFCDDAFDKAMCTEVIEHIPDPRALLLELRRVVRPDGFIIVTIPNERLINQFKVVLQVTGIFDLMFPGVSRRMEDDWHLHEFDLGELHRRIRGLWRVERAVAHPSRGLPLRYLVALRTCR